MTYPEDVVPGAILDPDDRVREASDADVAERAMEVRPGYDEPLASDSIEAPQWDAHEQSRIVEYDDDYR